MAHDPHRFAVYAINLDNPSVELILNLFTAAGDAILLQQYDLPCNAGKDVSDEVALHEGKTALAAALRKAVADVENTEV